MMIKHLKELVNRLLLFKSFSSTEWKTRSVRRKYYVWDILKNSADYLGKDKSEIESLFGMNESYSGFPCRWAYFVEQRRSRKYYLVFYFDDEHLVQGIRYEYKEIV